MADGSKIQGADLKAAIGKILGEYRDQATISVQDAVAKVSRAGAKELRAKSAELFGKFTYAEGLTASIGKDKRGATGTVYNKTVPGLTHLLEKPHLLRNGRMSTPIPHIEPVEQLIIAEFQSEVEKGL